MFTDDAEARCCGEQADLDNDKGTGDGDGRRMIEKARGERENTISRRARWFWDLKMSFL